MFEAIPTIFLICRDFQKSVHFYSSILELQETSRASDHVRYKIGDIYLVIHAPISDDEMREWNLEPLTDPRGSGVIVTLQPKNVDFAYDTLLNRGADILLPPRDAPWGTRLFIVRDPNGFLIEISRSI